MTLRKAFYLYLILSILLLLKYLFPVVTELLSSNKHYYEFEVLTPL